MKPKPKKNLGQKKNTITCQDVFDARQNSQNSKNNSNSRSRNDIKLTSLSSWKKQDYIEVPIRKCGSPNLSGNSPDRTGSPSSTVYANTKYKSTMRGSKLSNDYKNNDPNIEHSFAGLKA